MPIARSVQNKAMSAPRGATQTSTVTVNPSTKVIVKINQLQSLHIIQTTVVASLSTILFLRNLFPNQFFERRRYSLSDPNLPYVVAEHDVHSLKQQHLDEKSVSWDILAKGRHKHADKILSWLVL